MLNGQIVETPEANDFFKLATLEHGRKALMGDRAKFEGTRSHTAMERAENQLVDAFDKLKRLQGDKTRPLDVHKHVYAEGVAKKVVAAFEQSKATLEADGEKYAEEAVELQEKAFSRASSTEFELKANLEFIQGEAKKKNGPMAIREAAKDDRDVAYLIYRMKPHLFGMSKEVHSGIWAHCVKLYSPQSLDMLEWSRQMHETADKHGAMIKKIGRCLYSPTIAAQAATRVED